MTTAKKMRRNCRYSGRYLAERTREVSSQGRKASRTIEPPSAMTPRSLFGMAKIIRDVEHEPGKEQTEHAGEENILHGGVGRECDRILLGLGLVAGRIVLPDHVQRPDVQHDDADDDERQEV